MKVLLFVIGVLMSLVGGVLTLAIMRGPSIESQLACGGVQEKRQAADLAVKKYQGAKGAPDEEFLKLQSEEATRSADREQIGCDEAQASHRTRKVIAFAVLGAGVFISLMGFLLLLKGPKRSSPA